MLPLPCNFVCMWLTNNIWVAFWLRMKLILGDSTETLSGFQTQDKILDLLSTPELLFKEKVDKKKQYFLGENRIFLSTIWSLSKYLWTCFKHDFFRESASVVLLRILHLSMMMRWMHYAEPTWLDQLPKKPPHEYSPAIIVFKVYWKKK